MLYHEMSKSELMLELEKARVACTNLLRRQDELTIERDDLAEARNEKITELEGKLAECEKDYEIERDQREAREITTEDQARTIEEQERTIEACRLALSVKSDMISEKATKIIAQAQAIRQQEAVIRSRDHAISGLLQVEKERDELREQVVRLGFECDNCEREQSIGLKRVIDELRSKIEDLKSVSQDGQIGELQARLYAIHLMTGM